MRRYRVVKVGYSFYVQRYGIVNYDGIRDYDWKDCARFDDEESAIAYMNMMDGSRKEPACRGH